MSLSDKERLARLRLFRSNRIGPVQFSQLLARFGTAIQAIEAIPEMARRTGGSLVLAPADSVEAEMARGYNLGARLLCLGEAQYPELLAHVPAAPPLLWVLGPLKPQRHCVAIVGARNASAIGLKMAESLSAELSLAGFQIISGMARGIDTRAHQAALSGGTLAALGGGIDDIYPEDNRSLYDDISQKGLILSESPVGYRAQAKDFPRRNRIIAGMALATVVVEAELRSGSLITARLAAEQNREVLAVPGSPLDPRARGCNDLLRKGATLCESAVDVLSLLEPMVGFSERSYLQPFENENLITPPTRATPDIDEEITEVSARLLSLLSVVPINQSEAFTQLKVSQPVLRAALSELEIMGLVQSHEGGMISRSLMPSL